jgi:hypothetical protein
LEKKVKSSERNTQKAKPRSRASDLSPAFLPYPARVPRGKKITANRNSEAAFSQAAAQGWRGKNRGKADSSMLPGTVRFNDGFWEKTPYSISVL